MALKHFSLYLWFSLYHFLMNPWDQNRFISVLHIFNISLRVTGSVCRHIQCEMDGKPTQGDQIKGLGNQVNLEGSTLAPESIAKMWYHESS